MNAPNGQRVRERVRESQRDRETERARERGREAEREGERESRTSRKQRVVDMGDLHDKRHGERDQDPHGEGAEGDREEHLDGGQHGDPAVELRDDVGAEDAEENDRDGVVDD